MGFTGDQEDVNSMSLTVVHNLLEKHHVEMTDIGWMGVGTETILGNHLLFPYLIIGLHSHTNQNPRIFPKLFLCSL